MYLFLVLGRFLLKTYSPFNLRENVYNKGYFWFPFLNIGCIGLILVHTFYQPIFNIFRVPVTFVNLWTWYIILPLSKKNSSLPSPPKNCNFLLNIYPPIFQFQVVLLFIIVTISYLTASRSL